MVPGTPIASALGDSTHGRPHPHGNARSEAVALRALPPEAHRRRRARPRPVPTPEAAPGFGLPGPSSPPPRRCRWSAPRPCGLPGAATPVPLGAGWKRRPTVSAAPASPGATSLCHRSQQRKHVTVGPKHSASPILGQWGERQPLSRSTLGNVVLTPGGLPGHLGSARGRNPSLAANIYLR